MGNVFNIVLAVIAFLVIMKIGLTMLRALAQPVPLIPSQD